MREEEGNRKIDCTEEQEETKAKGREREKSNRKSKKGKENHSGRVRQ